MRVALVAIAAVMLMSCRPDDMYSYRYYCQDPANVNDEYCTSKQCEVDRECPHHLSPIKECKGE